jgi:predicted nucleotidyltransferase
MPKKKPSKKTTQKNGKPSKKELIPTLNLRTEKEIAMDFAVKVYKKFDKIVKSVILFGSTAKNTTTKGSDIDIIIVIDDATIRWDQELIAWYREELEKIIQTNPYKGELHINTVKLTTWWEDLMRGEPIILNVLRYGEAMIDFAGFFNPLKHLLIQGKIKQTPEAIYNCLQRAPEHFGRSKMAEMGAIEGLYWAMVDSAHGALIAAKVSPPSPEHIPGALIKTFVDRGKLKMKYVLWFRDLSELHKRIEHKELTSLKGIELDQWQERTEEFMSLMIQLVKEIIS